MRLLTRLALLLGLIIAASAAYAVQPDEVMRDPVLEARARALSAELRCMVCQNQSIDDSDAPLARDIRLLIRDRIAGGESNDAVRGFLVSRYGDFILLKPPFTPQTLLLWAGAPLALVAGALAIWRAARRRQPAAPPLNEAEEARLAAIVEESDRM
jgi:cytochrome c-type biogenesis protein CcmH